MKKILLLMLFACSICVNAEDTSDYLYATDIKIDPYDNSYYFNVCLEGENYYTAYGVDIQLPNGLEVMRTQEGKPYIVKVDYSWRIDEEVIYPYTENRDGTKNYSHTVEPSFPNSSDYTHARVGCLSTANADLKATSGALFRVYVNVTCTATQWPVGTIRLYDVELDKVGAPFEAEEFKKAVLMREGDCTLPLNVSAAAHWSTCILPFDAEIPAGVKAYTCNDKDETKLKVTQVNAFEAYTPYILYSEEGYSGNISGTVDASEYPDAGFVTAGLLNGAIVPQTVTDGYVLQNLDSEGVKFYSCGGDPFIIPAGKCWVTATGSAKALEVEFVDADGIEAVASTTKNDGQIYTISGQRVTTMQPNTIYIKNGRKFVNK